MKNFDLTTKKLQKQAEQLCSDYNYDCYNKCALRCWLIDPLAGVCVVMKEEEEDSDKFF